jgi:hypothetical protein
MDTAVHNYEENVDASWPSFKAECHTPTQFELRDNLLQNRPFGSPLDFPQTCSVPSEPNRGLSCNLHSNSGDDDITFPGDRYTGLLSPAHSTSTFGNYERYHGSNSVQSGVNAPIPIFNAQQGKLQQQTKHGTEDFNFGSCNIENPHALGQNHQKLQANYPYESLSHPTPGLHDANIGFHSTSMMPSYTQQQQFVPRQSMCLPHIRKLVDPSDGFIYQVELYNSL